jgi:predicted ester cyclase
LQLNCYLTKKDKDMSQAIEATLEAQNKATMRKLTQAFNELDRESWDSGFADPCLFHFPPDGGEHAYTPEEHWQSVLNLFKVFPDLKASIDGLIAEGDRVFVRWSYVGTHLGKGRRGVEPSGEKIDWWIVWAEYRFEDGLAAEVWEVHDLKPWPV